MAAEHAGLSGSLRARRSNEVFVQRLVADDAGDDRPAEQRQEQDHGRRNRRQVDFHGPRARVSTPGPRALIRLPDQ